MAKKITWCQAAGIIGISERQMLSAGVITRTKGVRAGIGEIAATGGEQQSLSVVRFFEGTVEIHARDTVEWTNLDPALGHTTHFWGGSVGSL